MSISIEDVEYLADLAKLKLSEREKRKFQKELEKIIRYIDQLKEVDTEKIPPTSHVIPMENVLREDKILTSLSQDEALANAPEKEDGYFKVPKVI
ncbi:MAG: glutamyl-tRNA amidotransferase [Bacteroides sp. SM23_62]|nr:MAG: glutamyl-tRNA amidotransferase [Bacteroides sp. SM23_62]